MIECEKVDALITAFVDGESSEPDRSLVADHLRVCAPCRRRVEAESAVRQIVRVHAARARSLGAAPEWTPRAYRLGQPAVPVRPVLLTVGAAAAALAAVVVLRPQPALAVGVIGDSFCGHTHLYTSATRGEADCTLGCVARGAEFVLIADGTVYKISNQEFPDLASFANARVEITGQVDDESITIARIAPDSRAGL